MIGSKRQKHILSINQFCRSLICALKEQKCTILYIVLISLTIIECAGSVTASSSIFSQIILKCHPCTGLWKPVFWSNTRYYRIA